MAKESKNLGITKACPECKKILIKSANIIGVGSFKTKCPHCKTLIAVQIGQKSFVMLGKVLAVLVIFLLGMYQLFSLTGLNQKVAEISRNIAFIFQRYDLPISK